MEDELALPDDGADLERPFRLPWGTGWVVGKDDEALRSAKNLQLLI